MGMGNGVKNTVPHKFGNCARKQSLIKRRLPDFPTANTEGNITNNGS